MTTGAGARKVSVVAAVPVVPAGSVATTSKVWVPTGKGAKGTLQAPPTPAVTPGSVWPATVTVIVDPSFAVPVTALVALAPVGSVRPAITGAGPEVSTVSERPGEAVLTLPATSVVVVVMVCAPVVRASASWWLQAPVALVCTEPLAAPSTRTVTLALASTVPVRVGRSTLVRPSVGLPESEPGAKTGARGVSGATESSVTTRGEPAVVPP
ncbi:hypothetical protein D3C72_706410 [compost metagenome]